MQARQLGYSNQSVEKNAAASLLAALWLVISNVALSYHSLGPLSTGFGKVLRDFLRVPKMSAYARAFVPYISGHSAFSVFQRLLTFSRSFRLSCST